MAAFEYYCQPLIDVIDGCGRKATFDLPSPQPNVSRLSLPVTLRANSVRPNPLPADLSRREREFCSFPSSCLGMGFLKLQLPEERPSRSLQDQGSQAGAWEPARGSLMLLYDHQYLRQAGAWRSQWERQAPAWPLYRRFCAKIGGLSRHWRRYWTTALYNSRSRNMPVHGRIRLDGRFRDILTIREEKQ